MQHVVEDSRPSGWKLLKGPVTADESFAETLSTILDNTYTIKGGNFIDLLCIGTLVPGNNSYHVTICEINDAVTPGTRLAYKVQHAFKDGSEVITVDHPMVIPMITVKGEIGVFVDGEIEESGTTTMTIYVRES